MPHILIVDDERSLRSMLALNFARAGYEVTMAGDAFEAISLCASKVFDAMLSDVDMPKMNGHELVGWIAGNHPKIRCVLMSALNNECEECPFASRCILLRKPFLPKEAVALITQILSEGAD